MLASLRFFRYFVLGLFLICNTIIAIVSAWNLNLIQEARLSSSSLSVRTDVYLIVVGCMGLALVFPVLFHEVARRNAFIVKVWFECAWVGLFAIMTLSGAASASVAAADELCSPFLIRSLAKKAAMCSSIRVIQGFTWTLGLFLFIYWIMLFGSSMLQRTENEDIWQTPTRKFPWFDGENQLSSDIPKRRLSQKTSVGATLRRLSLAPSIVAPRPRNAANENTRRQILSFRSGLSGDFGNFTFPPPSMANMAARERPVPPAPLVLAPEPPSMATRNAAAVTFGHSLYPQYVQEVITDTTKQTSVPATQPLPRQAPSPPPMGDWPRMNPAPRRKRSKPSAEILQLHIPRDGSIRSQPASAPTRGYSTRRPAPAFGLESSPTSAPALQSPPTAFSSRSRPVRRSLDE